MSVCDPNASGHGTTSAGRFHNVTFMPQSMSRARRRMPSRRAMALFLALLGGGAFVSPLEAAECSAVAARDEAVDAATQPGDDFFRYANGGWLEATQIPAGKGQWGARGEIAERTRRQLVQLIDDAVSAPPGSDARKVADFRAAYLNEAAIEARRVRGRSALRARPKTRSAGSRLSLSRLSSGRSLAWRTARPLRSLPEPHRPDR